MVTDAIADMLIQIKNAVLSGRTSVELPHSRVKEELAKVLLGEGYIGSFEKVGTQPKFMLRIDLKYADGSSVITDLKRVSKPGLRVYVDRHAIPSVVGGMGVAIISTPQGIMTGKEAKKRGIGGELLCEIW